MVAMLSPQYRVPVKLEMEIKAGSAGAAKEKAGQVVEQIPIRMESVLSRLRITRHEVEVRYDLIALDDAGDGAPRGAPPAIYKVPMEALMEMEAGSPDAAHAKAEEVLAHMPTRMQPVFAKYNVISVSAAIQRDALEPISSSSAP